MKKLLLLTVLVAPALASGDTLKLKDGTTMDGIIRSEDDREYVVAIEYAGGTITREERVAKSNVVEVVRFTPEQLMQREYEKTQRYRLDPQTSYQPDFYNQTISNVFVAFLRQYTNSPYTQELTKTIQDWELERDLVASGQALYGGKWISAAEAAKQSRRNRAQRLLRQGIAYLAQNGYESAVAQFHVAGQMTDVADVSAEARRQEAAAYKGWLDELGREQQQLNDELQRASQSTAEAPPEPAKPKTLRSHLRAPKPDYKLGDGEFQLKKPDGNNAMSAAATFNETIINNLHVQQDALAKKIADVQARAGQVPGALPAGGATAGPATASSAQPATITSVEEAQRATTAPMKAPDVLEALVKLCKNYWAAGVVAALVVLWVLLRAMNN